MPEHFCIEHQTVWFKRGNMNGFAHPINDDKGVQLLDRDGRKRWCNEIKRREPTPEVETLPASPQPIIKPSPKQETQPAMSKNDWAEKDKTTRKSIERQKALELATNWAVALLNSSSFTKKELLTGRSIIMAARDYEEYLNTGEIPVRLVIEKLEDTARAKTEGKEVKVATKSRLVEEAKRLGAIEIEEKEDSKTVPH